ncbi:MAG: tetratricopeptide repeat protein [Planctomycetales bacterium]|nr:tetratricopeptide repeat protein [Planctomycetales bacterium]
MPERIEEEAKNLAGLAPLPDGPRLEVSGDYSVQGGTIRLEGRWRDRSDGREGTVEVRREMRSDPRRLAAVQREFALRVLGDALPGTPALAKRLGNALREQGLLAEAREAYRHGAGSGSAEERAGLRFAEGFVSDEMGEREAAAEAYRRALEAAPGHREARVNLGLSLLALGRLDEARAELERARADAADDVEPLLHLALVEESAGDRERALARLTEAVRSRPHEIAPRANRAELLLRLGRHREAREDFAALRSEHPEFLPALLGLGYACAALGERDLAAAHLKSFLSSAEGRPGLGELAERARTELQKLEGG